MALDPLYPVGLAAALAAITLLRLSWARPGRSVLLNSAGWLVLAGSLSAGWSLAGAWGVTVMSLWAMAAAFVFLAFAAWQSPQTRRKPSGRRLGMLPEAGEPWHLGHRCATFLLVALAAMVSAIALAIATRCIVLLMGASEANANVLALFAVPLGWTAMAFLILMTDSRKRQLAIIAIPIASVVPAIIGGSQLWAA